MLSIILISYNRPFQIKRCLKSLQKQSYQDFEIILIDNNSQPVSRLELANFLNGNELNTEFKEKIDFIQSNKINEFFKEDNIGFTGANNLGIKLSKGDIILLLNDDTIHEEDFLEKMLFFLENPKVDIAQPSICYYDNPNLIWATGGKINKFSYKLFSHLNYLDKFTDLDSEKRINIDYAVGCALFIKRYVLNDIGLFDNTYFLYCEETDLCYRASIYGYNHIYCYPKARIYHDISRNFSNAYKKYYFRNRVIFCLKFFSMIIIIWQLMMSLFSLFLITSKLKFKRIEYRFLFKSIKGMLLGLKYGIRLRIRYIST